jgi:hypothetical protein
LWYKLKRKSLKVISFWEYIEPENLKWIIDRLEEKLEHTLEGWKLDMRDEWSSDATGGNLEEYWDLYEYIGKSKAKEIEKEFKPREGYFGSKEDKRTLAWKQAMLKSENKKL